MAFQLLWCPTLGITGSKKQSDKGAALFAVRVHAIVRLWFARADCASCCNFKQYFRMTLRDLD
jgi:hypothetical protein